ncbi:hypothetical protein Poli38472_011065 [Pythium oligandrum]|uniref:Hexose transporter 1 n=1 Tax=Pythium oligandrum TaxID=41045 RepID=A0A8K1CRK5_PYTOL|nr:hypothetical protein Poli38472_011065 [Pythium oligandrum]|eukprot:TMW67445.1 hypothetical protein Poli38472_011065 [Pythium oligandrum]
MAPTSFASLDPEPSLKPVVVDFVGLASPTPLQEDDQERVNESPYDSMTVNRILYTSVALALLHPMQIGWAVSQLNLSTFHDQDSCNARPVAPGTCVMFPGHSNGEWSWVVNLWIAGAVLGSIGCARLSDRVGRKKALALNAIVIIIGAAIQASASSLTIYALGRLVSGVASGAASALPNSYINEISPPHLRNRLGTLYQIMVCSFIILVSASFVFANTSTGWRYIGGFPIVLGGLFLLGAPSLLVESPAWLLEKGRRDEAEQELARLFGEHNVQLALSWLDPHDSSDATASKIEELLETPEHGNQAPASPWKTLFSPEYRLQTIIAVVLAFGQQVSGINVAFMYSSSMFKDAGVQDDRIGSMIVNVVNLMPTLFAGGLGTRFGNRRMILLGHAGMGLSCVGIIFALSANSPGISIVFTALYVAAFATSVGPLVYVVITTMFPNALRASGTSLCLFSNWSGQMIIGIGYPYVSDALGALAFLPFLVMLLCLGLFHYKFLPETTGKTTEEVQEIFRSRRRNKSLTA